MGEGRLPQVYRRLGREVWWAGGSRWVGNASSSWPTPVAVFCAYPDRTDDAQTAPGPCLLGSSTCSPWEGSLQNAPCLKGCLG